MGQYINNTSLGFILVFILIIAVSLSLFRVIAHFDEGGENQPPAGAVRAESSSGE